MADTNRFQFDFAVRSHSGLVREHNEDDFLAAPEHQVFVVADGMGGHAAGMVASGECVRTVLDYLAGGPAREVSLSDSAIKNMGNLEESKDFSQALRVANREIYLASARTRALAGMGTTAVGVRFAQDQAIIANVGDSRCYLLRNRELEQITIDHSLSNFLLALGREQEARMARATMSNVIMRALGLDSDVTVDVFEEPLEDGDTYMMCSDGLTDLVDDDAIEEIMSLPISLEDQVDRLIEAALDEGGRDNVTVMLVRAQLIGDPQTYNNVEVPTELVEDFGNEPTQKMGIPAVEDTLVDEVPIDVVDEDDGPTSADDATDDDATDDEAKDA